MKLQEIIQILNAEVILDGNKKDLTVQSACSSDLMSDVLTSSRPGAILITGLTTTQVIYTAEVADISIVCFVRGKKPSEATVKLAKNKGITLLRVELPMFESCGRLYERGLRGCSEHAAR